MKISDTFVLLVLGCLSWLVVFLSTLLTIKDLNANAQIAAIAPFITGAFVLIASYFAWVSVQRQIGIAEERHKEKITGLNKTIFSELADRVGRCLNDFISFPAPAPYGRFRPIDSIALPSVGTELGLLKPEALLAVTQFYSRLAGVSQAIDTAPELIKERLKACLAPGLAALKHLEVPDNEKAATLAEVKQNYSALRNLSGDFLPLLQQYA